MIRIYFRKLFSHFYSSREIRNSTSPYGMRARSISQPQIVSAEENQKQYESKFFLPVPEPQVKFDLNVVDNNEENEVTENKDITNEDKDQNINNDNMNNGKLTIVEAPQIVITPTAEAVSAESAGVQPFQFESSFKLRLTSKLRAKRLQAVAVFSKFLINIFM